MPTLSHATQDQRFNHAYRDAMALQPNALQSATVLAVFTDAKPNLKGGCQKWGWVRRATPYEQLLDGDGDQEDGADLVLTVNSSLFGKVDDKTRIAILDHLLHHAHFDEKSDGPESKGSWKITQHDVGDFAEVMKRHGAWDQDAIPALRIAQQITLPDPDAEDFRQATLRSAEQLRADEVVRSVANCSACGQDHPEIRMRRVSPTEFEWLCPVKMAEMKMVVGPPQGGEATAAAYPFGAPCPIPDCTGHLDHVETNADDEPPGSELVCSEDPEHHYPMLPDAEEAPEGDAEPDEAEAVV